MYHHNCYRMILLVSTMVDQWYVSTIARVPPDYHLVAWWEFFLLKVFVEPRGQAFFLYY